MAHSASSAPARGRAAAAAEPSVGALVQSAMADVSTLIRSELELAKAEVGRSAKKAGISVAAFAVAGVMIAFSGIFFVVFLAELFTWLGLIRWISYLICFGAIFFAGALAGLVGIRLIKRIERPERTMESLRELPGVMRREAPGERHRDVPTVTNGHVELRGDRYQL